MDDLLRQSGYRNYSEWKEAFERELNASAAGFVRIGYILKVARDTDVLVEAGYSSVTEYAKAEYGLSKDIVSRWMAINDKYSKGGYSPELEEKYAGYGVAKLQEMLTLPDHIADEIPPEMTRAEIQDIKREIKDEDSITELEVMMEEPPEERPLMEQVLRQLFYDHRELYTMTLRLQAMAAEFETNIIARSENVMDLLAPKGMRIEMVRISQIGRIMLTIRGTDYPIVLVNHRTQEKQEYPWRDFLCHLTNIFRDTVGLSIEEAWENEYGEPYKVAPPEPEPTPEPPKKEKKPAPKKPTAEERKKKAPKPEEKEEPKTEPVSQVEEDVESGAQEDSQSMDEQTEDTVVAEPEKEEVAPVQPDGISDEEEDTVEDEPERVTGEIVREEKGQLELLRDVSWLEKYITESKYDMALAAAEGIVRTLERKVKREQETDCIEDI